MQLSKNRIIPPKLASTKSSEQSRSGVGDSGDQDKVKNSATSPLFDKLSFKDFSKESKAKLVHLSQQSISVEDLCRQDMVRAYEETVKRTSMVFKNLLDTKIPNEVRNASESKNIDVVAVETLLLTLNTVVTPVFNKSVLPELLKEGPVEATTAKYLCHVYYVREWQDVNREAKNLYKLNQNTYTYPLADEKTSDWVSDTWVKNHSHRKSENLTSKDFFDFWANHLNSYYEKYIHLLTGRKFEEWSQYAKECAKRNPN